MSTPQKKEKTVSRQALWVRKTGYKSPSYFANREKHKHWLATILKDDILVFRKIKKHDLLSEYARGRIAEAQFIISKLKSL